MTQYLIQVSQPANVAADRIAMSVRTAGSHFATHASWRQQDGVATGTLMVEASDRQCALRIVPPNMRSSATVVETAEAPWPLAA